jgi:hypothetical protein
MYFKFKCIIFLVEEQGSGMDKIIYSVEEAQLPAPIFRTYDNSTQVILYAYRPFSDYHNYCICTDRPIRTNVSVLLDISDLLYLYC